MDKLSITAAQRKCALEHLEKLAYSNNEDDYLEKYNKFSDDCQRSVVSYFNTNWHGIRKEWVKGLKSFHLKNDTTNRVESFFSKLKAYFSPRSSLRETLTGVMSCVESLRCERRFRQVRHLNRVKLQDMSISSVEKQYLQLLTPYAFSAVQQEIQKKETSSTDRYQTTASDCQCLFFRGMRLPCRHIVQFRESIDEDVFVPDLVSPRWTHEYNSIVNVQNRSAEIRATVGTPIRERAVLTANQKYRKATTKLQRLASLMSEEGMPVFLERMEFIDQLISHWEQKQSCTLLETVTLQNDTDNAIDGEVIASCPMFPELPQEATEEETSQDQGIIEEPHQGYQESATETSQGDVNETSQGDVNETNAEPSTIDFSNVHLPVKARTRGRPKGAVKRVIGLPKRSQKQKDESSDPKPRKRGRPTRSTSDYWCGI